ncbi:hypothetical protein Ancab_013753 [Ancistrocladus abbreviatus]
MDYGQSPSDHTDTDDELPPYHNRVPGGAYVSSAVDSGRNSRLPGEMESQIHHLEKEAYFSVLRAFKAQADAITWDKEGLITELRKELRVSDDEHRELLGRVNNDDVICRIREWRETGGHQAVVMSTAHPVHDVVSSPTFSASRKKQRTSQSLPPIALPPSATHLHTVATSVQPSPSIGSLGPRGRKFRRYPSTVPNGNNEYSNTHGSSGVPMAHETAGLGSELIGRRVYTRWPDDNNFYEAVITQYDQSEGRHLLTYDINTPEETWEWVALKEIPSEDIRWVGEDPGVSLRGGRGGHGDKKSLSHGGAGPCSGRSLQQKELLNGIAQSSNDDIEILHTDTLIKEVEKVVAASHPDRLEIEKAKKMLKDHEQALIDAISRLTYVSDGESDGEQFQHRLQLD